MDWNDKDGMRSGIENLKNVVSQAQYAQQGAPGAGQAQGEPEVVEGEIVDEK